MYNKLLILIIIFLKIILYSNSVNYLSYYNRLTDDCICRIFITNYLLDFSNNSNKDVNETFIDSNIYHFIGDSSTCIMSTNKDSFLEKYFEYPSNTYLNIQIQDTYFCRFLFLF